MSDSKQTAAYTASVPTPRQRIFFLLRLAAGPIMFFAAGIALLAMLGVAQRQGWIVATRPGDAGNNSSSAAAIDYICPMMCTPPQQEPGRCPVCAMELVPASGGGSSGDERSVVVDPATRRVINIQTVSVRKIAIDRAIRAVGEIGYDEGKMKTIAAYSAGRFDKMYVDYTGAIVKQGDRLAEFYSPDLYSAQVEYLQTTEALESEGNIAAVRAANQKLHTSARQRLFELGMPNGQIDRLARDGKALNRLDIVAPMHGTVIERLAVEGEYVQQGQPVFRLGDLSTVWLLLKLFPPDAASVRYGQSVEAQLQSVPDRTFAGRIAFIDPEVDKQSRTVEVRVVLDNREGLIRVGDYAKAEISVPVRSSNTRLVYDPELANKWISPRHPHVISDAPGPCKLCGVALVPAAELGFTDEPQIADAALVLPRNSVLSAADESIVYVEVETGRFEIRRVVTGAVVGEQVVIVKGLAEGEKVATSGNFLLDSQMQLAGNPSLIDPSRAVPPLEMLAGFSAKELAEIQQLPEEDQTLATKQMICPVTEYKLGSMGVPPKVDVNGKTIFICCEGCREGLLEEPEIHLARLENHKMNGPSVSNSEESFAVPEIGDITPIKEDADELPSIESFDANDAFEIEVPELISENGENGGLQR